MKKSNTIDIKGSRFYYSILSAFIIGGLLGTGYLLIEGFKFTSGYSFIWLFGGLIFFPVFLYLFCWFLPGLIPGRSLFSIVQGPGGSVTSRKGDISFADFKHIELRRNGLTLVNSIYVENVEGVSFRIPTYDLIDDTDFAVLVDQYIYPYMNVEAKAMWDGQVNLKKLYDDVGYERSAENEVVRELEAE
ncbi:DUF5381 family protein [Metabacillus sp. SLBN-84]